VTFKAPPELVREMNHYATLLGMSRSELIRAAIKDFIARKQKQQQLKLHRKDDENPLW